MLVVGLISVAFSRIVSAISKGEDIVSELKDEEREVDLCYIEIDLLQLNRQSLLLFSIYLRGTHRLLVAALLLILVVRLSFVIHFCC